MTAGSEGDQIELGENRSETFWNRKIGLGSTPTEEGLSRIDSSFEKSSKGYYFLNCPDCGGEHIRLFRQPTEPVVMRGEELSISFLSWEGDNARTAVWVCPDCGSSIGHEHHRNMIKAGHWRGEGWSWTKEDGFIFDDSFEGTIGFSIWAGYSYSPNSTPAKMVKRFIRVKESPEKLKTFVNTVLGEVWKEAGETVSAQILSNRREEFAAEVPEGGLILTCGVDVEADRLEVEVVAWGDGEESWSIDYQVLIGDPSSAEVWEDLTDLLKHGYKHELGRSMRISSALIDSGYLTKRVYDFGQKFGALWVYAGKGIQGASRPIIESSLQRRRRLSMRKRKGVKPEIIGVDEAKAVLYRRLTKINTAGAGFCHFPNGRDFEYFEQLTAEKSVVRYRKGRASREWVSIRARNEALDCRNYAYAALLLENPDYEKLFNKLTTVDVVAKKVKKSAPPQQLGSDDWGSRW